MGLQIISDIILANGVRLCGDLYLPNINSCHPVILHRTDDNRGMFKYFYESLNALGFAVYVQSIRGCQNSGGEFMEDSDETDDSLATLKWLIGQPWCSGLICGFGLGYSGKILLDTLRKNDNKLSAAIIIFPHQTNIPCLRRCRHEQILEWAEKIAPFSQNNNNFKALQSEFEYIDHYQSGIHDISACRHLSLAPALSQWLRAHATPQHSETDDSIITPSFLPLSDIPTLFMTGWHHFSISSMLQCYQENTCRNMAPSKLTITQTPPSNPDFFQPVLDWLRIWLSQGHNWQKEIQGIDFNIANQPNSTEHTAIWPPLEVKEFHFYLNKNGLLALEKETEASAYSVIPFSPDNLTPSIGGLTSAPEACQYAVREQSYIPALGTEPIPLTARKDVITFTSAPLRRPMIISGQIHARIWASSENPEASIAILLLDIDEENNNLPSAINICNGCEYLKYSETPGGIRKLDFALSPIAYCLPARHCLQIAICSALFPLYDCAGDHQYFNTIYHDVDHPSQLIIPIRQNK